METNFFDYETKKFNNRANWIFGICVCMFFVDSVILYLYDYSFVGNTLINTVKYLTSGLV